MFPHKEKDKEAVAVVKAHDFGNKYLVEIYARQLNTLDLSANFKFKY